MTGDFNADAIADLAVVNHDSDTVTILLGNGSGGRGDGTFTAQSPIAVAAPFAIVTGDWNKNGILDLAVARYDGAGNGDVRVLLGNGTGGRGNGTFTAGTTIATPSGVTDVAVGDFDADGILDLATANFRATGPTSTSGGSILFGNGTGGRGDGTFNAGAEFAVPDNAVAVTAGDWNADGVLDLAFGTNISTLATLPGNGSDGRGNGTFATATTLTASGIGTNEIIAADLDDDGVLDLIAVGGDTLSIRFGNSN